MKMRKRVQLLLVDDHAIVRGGIRAYLEAQKDLVVVGEASTGAQALQMAKTLSPDIVLMDIGLPRMNGLEATRLLRQKLPKIKVIVLTMHQGKEYALEVARAGAHGYVLKGAVPEELVRAIRAVERGETFFETSISAILRREKSKEAAPALPSDLSGREKEVLSLLADGLVNKQVGQRLGIATRTVETHRENIMRKLNLHNLASLTKYAISTGLLKLR